MIRPKKHVVFEKQDEQPSKKLTWLEQLAMFLYVVVWSLTVFWFAKTLDNQTPTPLNPSEVTFNVMGLILIPFFWPLTWGVWLFITCGSYLLLPS